MPNGTDSNEATQTVWNILTLLKKQLISWERLLELALLLAVCLIAAKVLMALARRAISRTSLDKSAHRFLLSALRGVLLLVVLCVLLGYLGIPTASLVAVLGVAGLALSLALQGILANLAGGLMLLGSKPFTAGDYVEAGGVSGTVVEIGLVYTKLSTVDNKIIFVPNGEISAKTIVNYTSADKRQIELKFSASYGAPQKTVKECIARVVGEHPKTLPTPEPLIRVCRYGDSSIEYILRVWCATEDYWPVYYDLMEQVKEAFDGAGVEMTYNHLNVHLRKEKGE